MSEICPACLGKEFSFQQGPCNLCNHPILGFAIQILETPQDREKFESPDIERAALLRGIAAALAESLLEVGRTVEKPF